MNKSKNGFFVKAILKFRFKNEIKALSCSSCFLRILKTSAKLGTFKANSYEISSGFLTPLYTKVCFSW